MSCEEGEPVERSGEIKGVHTVGFQPHQSVCCPASESTVVATLRHKLVLNFLGDLSKPFAW